MKRVPVQIFFGRSEMCDRQARRSDQGLQSPPQRSVVVDNSNYSAVIVHGLSPTILLGASERLIGAVVGTRSEPDRCCRFRPTMARSFVPRGWSLSPHFVSSSHF